MRPIVPALLVLLLIAGPAAARIQYDTLSVQAPATGTAEDEWGQVTVTHHYPGPALWRVKRGDSQVYIVGGLPVMEKRLEWDRARVGKILDQANVLLTSPKAKGGVMGFAAWQMTKGNGLFRSLYDVLPSDVGGHFWRTAKKNGLDPQDYAKDSPVVAVMKLRDDIYEKHGLSTNDPEKML
ncbi:MAG: TraB/GumN family protein, partial [Asticcacaulis sp.]|nr:TraB/GumN family protein [Asticcacaulis sp.]